jgi:hypothetical protein
MAIVNYWPMLADSGFYSDYVGGMSLSTVGSVSVVADRFGNANSSFQTPGTAGNYVQAPAGYYFSTGSFSITMWVNQVTSTATLFDFANGAPSNNIHFVLNYASTCLTYFEIYTSGSTCQRTCSSKTFPVGAWTHLAITYNASNLTSSLYLNGNFTGSANSVSFVNVQITLARVTGVPMLTL